MEAPEVKGIQLEEITHRRFLAVEGKDEKCFFETLLKHMGISACQVTDFQGKDHFHVFLPAFKLRPGFDKLEVLAVVRDADTQGIDASFASISGTLSKYGLEPPDKNGTFSNGRPRIGIFIIHDESGNGMLEDLCLRTVKTDPAFPCVENFAECVTRLPNPPKNLSKSKVQAFLAAMPVIARSVGLGAEKGYWDLDSPELETLKSFLHQLAK